MRSYMISLADKLMTGHHIRFAFTPYCKSNAQFFCYLYNFLHHRFYNNFKVNKYIVRFVFISFFITNKKIEYENYSMVRSHIISLTDKLISEHHIWFVFTPYYKINTQIFVIYIIFYIKDFMKTIRYT